MHTNNGSDQRQLFGVSLFYIEIVLFGSIVVQGAAKCLSGMLCRKLDSQVSANIIEHCRMRVFGNDMRRVLQASQSELVVGFHVSVFVHLVACSDSDVFLFVLYHYRCATCRNCRCICTVMPF